MERPVDSSPRRPCAAVILAAGAGTRMRSSLPKALHPVGGAPMLAHVMAAAEALAPERIVVVAGHGAAAVTSAARAIRADVEVAIQQEQRGTAHAAAQARAALAGFAGDVFVLYADTPLVRAETLAAMAAARDAGAGLVALGFEAADPTGYGRLILEDGALVRIVEEKEATPAERAVTFANSGVICAEAPAMWDWLDEVSDDNAKGEFYLTDLVAIARAHGRTAAAVACPEAETLGVNSRVQLAQAEAAFQARARIAAMEAGVTLTAPETVFFALDTRIAPDVTVGPNVVFGPGAVVETGAEIRAFCHIEGAHVGAGAVIGPFARLRPGARIGAEAHVGNFVELKNAVLGEGAKANHLSYLGDASSGAGASIGAGTITCNYAGGLKLRSEIG
ncbi:MAG: bifunctional UDP-N-acetylglucosamine diphosphorylase/glucosamine-1-phosphate N-acetyltransferase GlmU, partial [Pseudomonadota bacterium]|nr:bifunctional UDP-N-acetylglucosamine diphosphorylase/glucosamine-1-phosphate N-acetyltransferase GlmU [Pseudomonadota bacterium]